MQARALLKTTGSYLAGQPHWRTQLQGVLLVALLGVIDYFTGAELSFSIFYLIPSSMTVWYAGRRQGVLVSALSAVTWLAADLTAGHIYSHPFIPYWNMTVRLGFFLVVVYTLASLKDALLRQEKIATTDFLTGAANTRLFMARAAEEFARCLRKNAPVAVAYLDCDNFKTVNDVYGHQAGDDMLRCVAEILRANVRLTDIVARPGGDEFMVLMPETGIDDAGETMERIRERLVTAMREQGWPVTFSIGAAVFAVPPASVDEAVKKADDLMYNAKRSGKNRVSVREYTGED